MIYFDDSWTVSDFKSNSTFYIFSVKTTPSGFLRIHGASGLLSTTPGYTNYIHEQLLKDYR